MAQLAAAYPDSNRDVQADVLPFWWSPRGPQRMFLPAIGILQTVMVLVLLAVCGNTANLMLARASGRQREIGVRLTLGAKRWRVVRLVLTESLLLGLGGSVLGAVIAVWGTSALRAMPLYGAFPIRFQTSVDGVTLLFALALGLGSGLLFGLAPAVQLARLDPQQVLRSGSAIRGRTRLSRILMAVEVCLAIVVLMAGAVFLERFSESRDTDPRFRRDGLWLAAYDLSGRNLDWAASRGFARRILDAVRALPSVDAAAISSSVPLDIHGLATRTFVLEGRARGDGRLDEALTNTVTPGYFQTMAIALTAGHDFAELTDPAAPAQAIVNEAFVRRFLQGAEPLGRALESRGQRFLIVGVAANSTYQSFGELPTPIVYVSYRDRPVAAGEIHVHVRPGSDARIGADLRQAVRGVDPTLPLYNVRTMPEHIERNLFLRRIPARMFMVLGPLLLCLAALGIYGVVSHAVSHRTREIALRLALGASRSRVVRAIVADSLTFVAIGGAVGWLAAYDVYEQVVADRAIDAAAFAGVPAVLLLVALAAAWLPARRAGRIDPAVALKEM
jgi:predicted permease